MYTTLVGRPLSDVDTPALILDLDALDHNVTTMAADIAALGAHWRPHSKANKTPAIVLREIAAGAIGVTCAKVGEAEVMAGSGIKDILIANQVVGPIKTRRLAHLAREADVIVAVDHPDNVRELDCAAKEAGTNPRVLVEVNTGMERCGVMPGQPTIELAKLVDSMPNLRFAGVMAWEGHSMAIKDAVAREAEIRRACESLVETADACRAAGLDVQIVSAGGTGTYLIAAGIQGITEVQAGGGVFGDSVYRDLGANVVPALSIMTQVTSRPSREKVIIDAGRKSLDPAARQPKVDGLEIAGDMSFSAEHGRFDLAGPSDSPRIGERLRLWSGYSDQMCHLHEYFIGVRNGVVAAVWPVQARGRLQ